MARPVACWNAASHSGGSGAPPEVHSRTPAVAVRRRSAGRSSSARNIDGTPASALTRCVTRMSATCSASSCSASTTVAPTQHTCRNPAASPKLWKSGNDSSTRSTGVTGAGRSAAVCARLASSARCDSRIPRGTPVVPDA